ncbi:low-density lipoprotein receptor-like isoform X3 [Rhodnius prolixus]|uniref:low-density lipoprotein receptor-like isoform X3 n=1 Tax=Rhodnius prolixus TaxID=13249 RepID=UPI003D18C5F3
MVKEQTMRITVLVLFIYYSFSTALEGLIGNGSSVECKLRQFRCNNTKCVQLSWMCDGENDCGDNSDETAPQCAEDYTCKPEEFRCHSGRCIPQYWQCDKEPDCPDESDEDPNTCKEKLCQAEEFTCRAAPGECVPLTWMCDDATDCTDGSDERACNETCRSDEFTCGNGKCIQQIWACDMDEDCEDGSDEKNCSERVCASNEFQCEDHSCILAKWKCDGDYDCHDNSDEKGCTNAPEPVSSCLSKEFKCPDHLTCIHQTWVCDGDPDCPDGADESPQLCTNLTCRPDQFQCSSRQCIPGHFHCNGQSDCVDGSDEQDCVVPMPTCKGDEFECGAGMCILMEKVCDRHADCPNSEDEPVQKCGINECLVDNGGCTHLCVDTPTSFHCQCRPGYRLVDNYTCDDINECDNPGACSQSCINEKGTFKCECEEGYLRDPHDRTRCKATEGHASLLFARRHDIRKISLDHHEMTSIVNDTKSATALDFVFRTGMIFWSDSSEQKIYKAPIDEGSERTIVISNEVTMCDGLAVDWLYSHIYWTDTGKNTIELANYEGSMHKTLIRDSLDEPRAIALNPLDGWMYWSDWGKEGRIERAGLDGSHRQVIVSYDIRWPNGLTLDLVRKRLYWVDAKLNLISSVNYDGSGRRVVLRSTETLHHPFSISVFEDFVYWTDWDKQAIFKANKFDGSNVTAITAIRMLQNPMVVHVYHPYRQPDGANHCAAVNGHCSHLCLPAPQINPRSPKISCACPDGLVLMKDGLMCTDQVTTKQPVTPTIATESTHKPTPVIINHKEDRPHDMFDEADSGVIASVVIAGISVFLAFASMIVFIIYRHYLRRNVTSMNFDNPVYRKTTEDQFSLAKSHFQTQRIYPATVAEEAQEPLTSPGSNEYV